MVIVFLKWVDALVLLSAIHSISGTSWQRKKKQKKKQKNNNKKTTTKNNNKKQQQKTTTKHSYDYLFLFWWGKTKKNDVR